MRQEARAGTMGSKRRKQGGKEEGFLPENRYLCTQKNP